MESWINSYFERFPLTDRRLAGLRYEEIRPTGTDLNRTSQWDFVARSGAADSYIDLSRSYLSVNLQILKGAEGVEVTDNMALQAGCSLFKSVLLYLNDQEINQKSLQEPALYQLFCALADKYDENEQTAQHLFYDTNNGTNAAEITLGSPESEAEFYALVTHFIAKFNSGADTGNLGQIMRVERMMDTYTTETAGAGGATIIKNHRSSFRLRIPLFAIHPFCFVRKPLRGVDVRLLLEREPNLGKVLIGDDALANIGLTIHDMSLNVCRIKPSTFIAKALNDGLVKGQPIPISYQNVECTKYPVSGSSIVMDVHASGPVVSHVIIGFQSTARRSTIDRNKLAFDRPKKFGGHISYGGVMYPMEREFNTDRSSGWAEIYEAFMKTFESSKLEYGSKTVGASHITYQQFMHVYPLFCFDLRPGEQTLTRGDKGQRLTVNFNLDWTGTPLAGVAYDMVVYIVTDEYIDLYENNGTLRVKRLTPSDLEQLLLTK